MKKLLCQLVAVSSLVACSSAAMAAADGFFLHAKVGWAQSDYSNDNFDYMSSSTIHKEALSLSPSFGYQLNPNFAFELTYLDWQTDVDNIGLSSNPQGKTSLRNGSVNNYSLDLSAKAMLPLDKGFGLFAKLGAAYVQSIKSGGLNDATLGNDYHNVYAIRPITTLGVSYEINDGMVLDLGATHLYEGSGIQGANFTYIGLARHFG